ncbi:hypothetical protein [Nocardia sp. NBC_01009]|nr:hypothetical protein OHA42_05740 [Nocardia sp. NBC_01009]
MQHNLTLLLTDLHPIHADGSVIGSRTTLTSLWVAGTGNIKIDVLLPL